jgi:hypothetical protein
MEEGELMRLLTIIILIVFIQPLYPGSPTQFQQNIIKRNGDVYVLINKNLGPTNVGPLSSEMGVYKFTKEIDYQRSKVGISSNPSIAEYEGLSVDKFGHLKFFRVGGDLTDAKDISTLTSLHPDQAGTMPGFDTYDFEKTGGVCSSSTVFTGTSKYVKDAGWVYRVDNDGDEGWFKLYSDSNGVRPWYGSGSAQMPNLPKKIGSPVSTSGVKQMLPPKLQLLHPDSGYQQHNGFWRHDCGRDSKYLYPEGTTGQGVTGSNVQASASSYRERHPSLGWMFFKQAHCEHVDCARGGLYTKIEKKQIKLYLDEFISNPDNNLLATQGAVDPDFQAHLQDGVDYFTGPGGKITATNGGYKKTETEAINSALTFAAHQMTFQACGDMCNSPGTVEPPVSVVEAKGWAKIASHGRSAAEQRTYMVVPVTDTAGDGSTTSHMEVQQITQNPDGTYSPTTLTTWDSYDKFSTSFMDADLANGNKHIIRIHSSDYTNKIRSVQTSRRIFGTDETKDWVYFSNIPTSHFNVSSSFWGTGGVVWIAKENTSTGNVRLEYSQYNHTKITTGPIKIGFVNAPNASPLYGIAADGDNNVFVIHGGKGAQDSGAFDDDSTIRRLLHPFTESRLISSEVCDKLSPDWGTDCSALASRAPTPLPADPSTNEGAVILKVAMSAGVMVEKIAPLANSEPEKIGIIPLENTSTYCEVPVYLIDRNNDGVWDDSDGGAQVQDFTCPSISDVAQSVIDSYRIELAVVNVANPINTGGDFQIDIVDIKDSNGNPIKHLQEDTLYHFRMENPPLYEGQTAQLNLCNNTDGVDNNDELSIYGKVDTVANNDGVGIAYAKDRLGASVDDFYDNKPPMGRLSPSFINKPLHVNQTILNTKNGFDSTSSGEIPQLGGAGWPGSSSYLTQQVDQDAQQTLRYRWRIKALSPPHSNKTYPWKKCHPLVNGSPGGAGDGTFLPQKNREKLHSMGFLDSTSNEIQFSNVGIVFDTCWRDMENTMLGGKMYYPDTLSTMFEDPGVYQVELHFAGLRFNADELTFLSNANDISAELGFSKAAYIVTVGATPNGLASEYVSDVVITNNDLTEDISVRSGIRDAGNELLKSAMINPSDFVSSNSGNHQADTRFPVYPVANYANDAPLIVTYENQRTPIVAEIKLKFFGGEDFTYGNYRAPDADSMYKYSGVGCWDYSYPGHNEVVSASFMGGSQFKTITKTASHPPNWNPENWDSSTNSVVSQGIVTSSTYVPEIIEDPDHNVEVQSNTAQDVMNQGISGGSTLTTTRWGYDALGDPETGCGVIVDQNTPFRRIASNCTFDDAHQGTLLNYSGFYDASTIPNHEDPMIDFHQSFYDWWEIKYAWFMRYLTPSGEIVKRVIRTGNLGEIWLLHNMSKHDDNWKNIVSDISPFGTDNHKLILESTVDNDYQREFKVRIPLFEGGILQGGNSISSFNNLMNNPIRDITDAQFGSYEDIWNQGIRPVKFNTPTEPTVIEIGFQVYAPSMGWEGRDPATPNGTDFTYYDAVYWGPQSQLAGYRVENDFVKSFVVNFGNDTFTSWNAYGTLKHPITGDSDDEAELTGLDLAEINSQSDVGGFFQGAPTSLDINYQAPGGRSDSFVEVAVLDSKPPLLVTSTTGGDITNLSPNMLSGVTGGRPDQDVFLEAWDYNPFAQWNNAEDVYNQSQRLIAPSLVNFSYDVGFDPRNQYGLGLKQAMAGTSSNQVYGFNLSYTNLEPDGDFHNAVDLPSFHLSEQNYNSTNRLKGTALPYSISNQGYQFNRSVLVNRVYNNFYYPNMYGTGTSYPQDGMFVLKDWDQSNPAPSCMMRDSSMMISYFECSLSQQNAVERINESVSLNQPKLYYYPAPNPQTTNGLRTQTANASAANIPMGQITFIPDNADYPYNMTPNGENSIPIVEQYSDAEADHNESPECNDSYDPFATQSDHCWIRSRWTIQKEKIHLPYFVSDWQNLTSSTYSMYAKARDVRIIDSSVTPPNASGWGDWTYGRNWKRVMGPENYFMQPESGLSLDGTDSLADISETVYNNQAQHFSNNVGSISVTDNSAPNFRVTITDFKTRDSVQYTVMSAQGYDSSSESFSDDAIFFKTTDKRSSKYANFIESCATTNDTVNKTNENDLWVNELVTTGTPACGSDWKSQAYVAIEDVRFQVRVEITDNRSLDECEIEVESIGSNVTRFPTPQLPDGSDDFKILSGSYESHRFPHAVSETGNQRLYRQSKILTAHHLYPNSGFYDVLKITVRDNSSGSTFNSRVLHLPIVVVGQQVRFRKIGDDKQSIR